MIFTIPLRAGATLSNVRYRWISNGVAGSELSAGITQPSVSFPVFRLDAVPPAQAEEVILYDSTALTNWNVGSYAMAFVKSKLDVIPPESSAIVIPGEPADLSLCRVYGYFETLANKLSDNIKITFTLSKKDPVKSERLITGRTIEARIVAGSLTDADSNPWQDLQRNDLLTPGDSQYLVTCAELGLKKHPITLSDDLFDLASIIP